MGLSLSPSFSLPEASPKGSWKVLRPRRQLHVEVGPPLWPAGGGESTAVALCGEFAECHWDCACGF